MGINFGDVIKAIRTKSGFNQLELSERIGLSTVHLSRMENNKTGVSDESLKDLSDELHFNFLKLNSHTNRFRTYFDYIAYFELDKALITFDVNVIEDTLQQFSIIDNFDYDEPEILKFYSLAIVYSDSDISKSMEYALKGLNIKKFSIPAIQKILLNIRVEDSVIAILSVISKNLYNLDKKEDAFKFSKLIYDHFREFLFREDGYFLEQSFFMKRQYIVAINNYAHMNFELKNYKKSIELCDVAIKYCNMFNILNMLLFLYKLKMENHYLVGEIEEAKECFMLTRSYSKTCNKMAYYDNLVSTVETDYPELLL